MDRAWFWRLLGYRFFALASTHPPAECERRLRAAVDETEEMFGKNPFVGSIGRVESTLKLRPAPDAMMSPRAIMELRLEPRGEGSRLFCRIGMGRLMVGTVVILCPVMFVGGVLAFIRTAMSAISGAPLTDLTNSFVIGLLFVAFGPATVFYSRTAAIDQDRELLGCVMSATSAELTR